jgi:hypothetical protein
MREWGAAVDGNEVRRLILPLARGWGTATADEARAGGYGYETAAVDELLDRVAAELDAGRPVAHLIEDATFPPHRMRLGGLFHGGYDFAAVDWLLSQLRRQDDPEAHADPWRHLPAWHYSMASPNGSAAEPAGQARHRAAMPRAARVQADKDYGRECAEACRDFGAQPGILLSLMNGGGELRTADQHQVVLVRALSDKIFHYGRRTYTLSRVKTAQRSAVTAEIGHERPGLPAHLQLPRTEPAPVARENWPLKGLAGEPGQPVLYTGGGEHICRYPFGYVQFPDRRWLRFPVRGTKRSNAIMTAVDQAGRQVARYMNADRNAIKITVHPDQQLTDELILTLALTAHWVSSFFDAP